MLTMLWSGLCALLLLPIVTCIQCMSSTGKPVDWYIVYKLPKLDDSGDPNIKNGYGHLYMDVDNPTWRLSTVSMNESDHAVAYTLKPIFNKKSDFMYLMYNDEDPNKKEPARFGHSKGVVAFDKDSGYWLVHSTPRFPPFVESGYYWPETATIYGQSFLCVSYRTSSLNDIAGQILVNYVQVYSQHVPSSFLTPNLEKVIKGKQPSGPPWSHLTVLTSMLGESFTSFAKSKKFYKELYEDWVAPTLKTDLQTETWLNGKGRLPSNCSLPNKVYNIDSITLPFGLEFHNSRDHSKWAVSMEGQSQWTCIGDINREISQEHRGGGTVCLKNRDVWTAFHKSVSKYEKCGAH